MTYSNIWKQQNTSSIDLDKADRARCRATRCLPGEIADYVLLPGDPSRAAMIANEWFEDGELVVANREFHSYTGTYKGLRVSVISTGLGSPGATMVVQDLPKLGVKAAIRVGTAGSAVEAVAPGDLVIASSAVRDEGVSHQFIPANYPAVADFKLTETMRKMAHSIDSKTHTGIVHTSDVFTSPNLQQVRERYAKANVLAFEMEAAAVLTIASLLSIPAGCIVSIDGYINNVAQGNTAPDGRRRDQGIRNAITIALDTLVALQQQEN
jgi:DeoD family purine-nucleoside phosphorylase